MKRCRREISLLALTLLLIPLGHAASVGATAAAATPFGAAAFQLTGETVKWVVPDGVDQLGVSATGGQGEGPLGGLGGWTFAVLQVRPGDELVVSVGGPGSAGVGGFGGGGNNGFGGGNTAGGGASDVRLGGDALADRVVVAGGGGGNGPGATSMFGMGGAGGGATAGAGARGSNRYGGGGGGSQAKGGDSGGDWASPGTLGAGAAGGYEGGAGGGGWFGGGSGGSNSSVSGGTGGGGGGGSSYATPAATEVRMEAGVNTGPGAIELTWPPRAIAPGFLASNEVEAFTTPGLTAHYRAPEDAVAVRLTARGGQGAAGGGRGGVVVGVLPVRPRQFLAVTAGGASNGSGGANGGGEPGLGSYGGGGASDVRVGGLLLQHRVLVAAGGGGGPGGGDGGAVEGRAGAAGSYRHGGGTGGTATAGGEGGGDYASGGGFGQGGTAVYVGGAGGGGWFGGGSGGSNSNGGSSGAGGGGSSFAAGSVLAADLLAGTNEGDGSVLVEALTLAELAPALAALHPAAAPDASVTPLLPPLVDAQGPAGAVFARASFDVNVTATQAVLLVGVGALAASLWVDGLLSIQVTRPDGATQLASDMGSTDCRLSPQDVSRRLDIGPMLQPGINTVRLVLRRNACPGQEIASASHGGIGVATTAAVSLRRADSEAWVFGSVSYDGAPAVGSRVQACDDAGGCPWVTTDSLGRYFLNATPASRTVTAFPTAGLAGRRTTQDVDLAGGVQAEHLALVLVATSLPAGSTVERAGQPVQTSGVPVLHWGAPTTYRTVACPRGSGRLLLEVPGVDATQSFPLRESPRGSGRYSALIPPLAPLHGNARFTPLITCPPPVAPLMLPSGGPEGGHTLVMFRFAEHPITGVEFAGKAGSGLRSYGAGMYSVWSPSGSGVAVVEVVLGDSTRRHLGTFTYIRATPVVHESPVKGGGSIIIDGDGFGDKTAVLIGLFPALKVIVESTTRLRVLLPEGGGQQPITVISNGGFTWGGDVNYVGAPEAGWVDRAIDRVNTGSDSGLYKDLETLITAGAENAIANGNGFDFLMDVLVTKTARDLGTIFGLDEDEMAAIDIVDGFIGILTVLAPASYAAVAATGFLFGVLLYCVLDKAGWLSFFDALIDPSGNVVDINGAPVAGATVSLLQQTAAGDYELVPADSPRIDPSINPQMTADDGAFSWMAATGTYKVVAESGACLDEEGRVRPVEAGPFVLPPPVTGLLLRLPCAVAPAADPTVTSVVARPVAEGGAELTILGAGLGDIVDARIGGLPASSVTVLSPHAVRGVFPAGTSDGRVTVTTRSGRTSDGGEASAVSFPKPLLNTRVEAAITDEPVIQGRGSAVRLRVLSDHGDLVPSGHVAVTDRQGTIDVVTLDGSGRAVVSLPPLAAGAHLLGLSYTGDRLHSGSRARLSVTVLAAAPTDPGPPSAPPSTGSGQGGGVDLGAAIVLPSPTALPTVPPDPVPEPGPSEPPASVARLTLTSTAVITVGNAPRFTGTATTGDGGPARGAEVTLLAKSWGEAVYRAVATTIADPDGSFSVRYRPERQAVHVAVSGASKSAPFLTRVHARVVVASRTSSAIFGYLHPAGPGISVGLAELRRDIRGRTDRRFLASTRTNGSGSFVLPIPLASRGRELVIYTSSRRGTEAGSARSIFP